VESGLCVKFDLHTLIHHQSIICCVAIDRFSLRRITYTPQSALLGALHLTLCWCPGLLQNPLPWLIKWKFDGGFWYTTYHGFNISLEFLYVTDIARFI